MSSLPFNPIVGTPMLADVLNNFKKEVFLQLNCHALGTVQALNVTGLRGPNVQVTLDYTKSFYTRNEDGAYVQTEVNYPVIATCPLVVLGGGGSNLTFPVSKGDKCLILFNDRDMSNWIAGATSGSVSSPRLHNFSDALALVGPRQTAIPNYDASNVVLDGGSHLIQIMNEMTTLKTVLFELISAINAMTVSVTVTGVATGLGTAPGTGTVSGVPGSVNTDIGKLLK